MTTLFTILLLSIIQKITCSLQPNSCKIIIIDQKPDFHKSLASSQLKTLKSFNTPCELSLLTSYGAHKRSWVLANKSILPKIYANVLPGLSNLNWVWFVYPETVVDKGLVNYVTKILLASSSSNSNSLPYSLADPNKNLMFASKLTDKAPTIIHHYAGHSKEEAYKLQFFNAAKSFICSKSLLKTLDKYLVESNYYSGGSRFHIDSSHELSELFDKATNSQRGWLVDDLRISKVAVLNFKTATRCDINTTPTINEKSDIFVAVKSASIFKKDRWPIIFDTWMHPKNKFTNVEIFSDKKDVFRNFKISDSFGIENTASGHCGKTDAIIRNFDFKKFKFLVVLDDDTIIGKESLINLLRCYNHKVPMLIGQRYGFNLQNKFGYNYITGGGGMIFTSAAVELYKSSGCQCPDNSSPDDMVISNCLEDNNGFIVHEPSIHQARPMDYTDQYLKDHGWVSFHKFWMCDGRKIYEERFGREEVREEL